MDKHRSFMSCDKLDRMACWVGTNVATAFFTSLERCSCINLSTADFEDDDEAKEHPLVFSRPAVHDGFDLDAQPTSATPPDVNKPH